MSQSFQVACVQNCAGREVEANTRRLLELTAAAAAAGAELVLLPEMASFIEPDDARIWQRAAPENQDMALAALRRQARDSGCWLLIGSLLVRDPSADDDGGERRVINRSYLIDTGGEIVARYDKLHLFDIDLDDGEGYRESNSVRAGERAVIAASPWGQLGLSICYDLRFAALYRALAQAGAQFLCVPAAFTATTGRAHWECLVRARAIETGSYVFAPNQCGVHAEGRRTWGHSLIVDPWGEILAEGGDDEGFISARIDPAQVARRRGMIPALQHDREIVVECADGPAAASTTDSAQGMNSAS